MAKTKTKKVRADLENKLKVARLAAVHHGIKHPEKIKAVGNVMCRGVKKPIYLIGNSFVMVAGHKTDIELAFNELGGRMCRCLEALREFRSCRAGELPPMFADFTKAAWQKRSRRRLLRQIYSGRYHGDDKPKSPDILLVERKVKLLLRLKCNYRITSDPRCNIDVRNTNGMGLAYGGRAWPTTHYNTPPLVSLLIKLNVMWRKVLVPAKLTVVDGHFITDVTKEEEGRQVGCDIPEAKRRISSAKRTGRPINVRILHEYTYHHSHDREELHIQVKAARLIFVDKFGNKVPKLLINRDNIYD
jgi:hypothetical protein